MEISLLNITECRKYLHDIENLYLSSFPIEERREWDNILNMIDAPHDRFEMTVIVVNNKFGGFITSWDLDDIKYVEHFATIQSLRGFGIGGKAMSHFIKQSPIPIVLEVELPDKGEMALRRIAFYKRNGFVSCPDYKYIQPPYNENLPEVPLMLMHSHYDKEAINLDKITDKLHRYVYKKA